MYDQKKKAFEEWLLNIVNSSITAKKYSGAIGTISRDMISQNIIQDSLY